MLDLALHLDLVLAADLDSIAGTPRAIQPAMWAALVGVFIASLVGSGHCAGMCGPIMLFAIGSLDARAASTPKWRVHLAYHLGRALSYTARGAAAGAAGAALDLGGAFVGLQRLAGLVFGTLMLIMGAGLIATSLGSGVAGDVKSKLRLPGFMKGQQRLIESMHRIAMRRPPVSRGWLVGLLTPLLPCGWLYLYVFAAAGTGSVMWGGAVLATFWLGTVPILAGLGIGLEALSAPLRQRLPLVSGLVVIAIGLSAVSGRHAMPSFSTDEQRALLAQQSQGLTVPDATPPCCNNETAEDRAGSPSDGAGL